MLGAVWPLARLHPPVQVQARPGFLLLSQDHVPYQQLLTLHLCACWSLKSTRPEHGRDPLALIPPPCCSSNSLSQKSWFLSVSIDDTVQGLPSCRTCIFKPKKKKKKELAFSWREQTIPHKLCEGDESHEGRLRERQGVRRGRHWADEAWSG